MEQTKRLELELADTQPSLAACVYAIDTSSVAAGGAQEETKAESPAPHCDPPRPDASTGAGSVFGQSLLSAEDKEQLNQIAAAWQYLSPEIRGAVLTICLSR
jgi:hypothetical protein